MATVTDYQLDSVTPVLIASGVGQFHLGVAPGSPFFAGGADVIIGGSAVTVPTGLKVAVPATGKVTFELGSTDKLWAVASGVGAPQVWPILRVLHTR